MQNIRVRPPTRSLMICSSDPTSETVASSQRTLPVPRLPRGPHLCSRRDRLSTDDRGIQHPPVVEKQPLIGIISSSVVPDGCTIRPNPTTGGEVKGVPYIFLRKNVISCRSSDTKLTGWW
ncbi:unnamed protein product [Ectocarpus sp. 12 AP-2014]